MELIEYQYIKAQFLLDFEKSRLLFNNSCYSMTTQKLEFEISVKKISFKQIPTSQNSIMCNLLYNNRKIDNTDPFMVPSNQKSVDLSSLKPLVFNIKEQQNKLPIYVYILYGEVSAKKIILKRTDMIKKYDIQHKNTFQFDQDLGPFAISYQVVVKKDDVSKQQIQRKKVITYQNPLKPTAKTQQPHPRSFKRPTMLEIGEKAEKIRKNSVEIRDIAQNQVTLSRNSQQKSQKTCSKSNQSRFPILTIAKDENTEQNLVKKDLKINLFSNFEKLTKKSAENNTKHNMKKQQVLCSTSNEKAHQSQISKKQSQLDHLDNKYSQLSNKNQGSHELNQNLHGSHRSHGDSHGGNHNSDGDHHDSHGEHHDSHGHHPEPMSLKLKTVVAMLIIGFLFLMYDALDERFSRKIRKLENVHGHKQNSEQGHSGHEKLLKKKKGGKKTNKVQTH